MVPLVDKGCYGSWMTATNCGKCHRCVGEARDFHRRLIRMESLADDMAHGRFGTIADAQEAATKAFHANDAGATPPPTRKERAAARVSQGVVHQDAWLSPGDIWGNPANPKAWRFVRFVNSKGVARWFTFGGNLTGTKVQWDAWVRETGAVLLAGTQRNPDAKQ